FFLGAVTTGVTLRSTRLAAAARLRRLVHFFRQLVRERGEAFVVLLHVVEVLFADRFARVFQSRLEIRLHVRRNLVAVLFQQLVRTVHEVVEIVLHRDTLALLLVLFGIRFRVAHHFLDVGFRETARSSNLDRLLFTGREILRGDV